jgi:DNA-binding GntR family transcriptional regulator
MSNGKSSVASQRVADVLAHRILSGDLKPGDRIKQDELAVELGMSRIPVRDALRILETRGLVSLKANTGARVRELTLKDLDISYRIRELIEPLLLADSLPNLTDADIEGMAEIKTRLEAVNDVDEYMPLSRDFHWLSFSRHESPVLADIVERLWDTTQSYRRAYARLALQDVERLQLMRDERDLLFRAIRRRETDLAPRILAVHIRRTHTTLMQYGHLHELIAG